MRFIGVVLAWGVVIAAGNEKKEQARFEGVWSFALVEVEGKKQAETPFASNKIVILKDGNYMVLQGQRITRGVLTVDPAKTPKHFDFTITDGPAKGTKAMAIYELDGDTYKISSSFKSKERPGTFESKPGSGLIVQILKREKQDLKEALTEVGRKELAGTWQAVSYALDGKNASDEDMQRIKLMVDSNGKATVIRDGKAFIASTTRIDPTKNPVTIDMTYTEGDQKSQTALGIYKIEDGVLTICRSAPDQARPIEFASKPGSGHTLMTYKRETAPKK